MGVHADEDGDDQVREEHRQAAPEEQSTAACTVHGVEGSSTADELHAVEDTRHDQLHVVFQPHGLEQGWRIVDESVDSDELHERYQ